MSKELDLGRVVGKDATINGENAVNIVAGNNIDIHQQGGTLTIGVDDTHFNDKSNPHEVTADQIGAVPVSRTVNGKSLSENISLSADDVGASPSDHTHADKQDKLTGTPDQYVTFDENGNAVAKQKDYSLFGFKIVCNESDPAHKIKYIAQNASYEPAHMDYEKDEFNYGDWADVWFIKNIKPVILKYDGTVIEELMRDDYTQGITGPHAFNVSSDTIPGNVMVGIPTVWVKIDYMNGDDVFYFSDQKLDDKFHAYAHTTASGEVVPYIYLPAYNGYKDDNGRIRSISGKAPTRSETGTNQISQARANNPNGKHMWDIETLADRNLINLLLLLIGKSTNTQAVFGNGNMNGSNNHAEGSGEYGILPTGTMNDKGLFWGSNADNLGVKVFGIENWWGNVYRRTQGLILDEGVYKIKMTYGTEDGSTCEGYNETGEGYVTGIPLREGAGISTAPLQKSNFQAVTGNTCEGHITEMRGSIFGLFIVKGKGGSSSTYFCDFSSLNISSIRFALFGSTSNSGSNCGAFACSLNDLVSAYSWNTGVSISCKPY